MPSSRDLLGHASTRAHRHALLALCGAVLGQAARAGEPMPERPVLPAWSLAGDDGAAAIWSNPANLGLDPDEGWMVLYSQALEEGAPAQVAAVTNGGPLAAGLVYRGGAGRASWWTLSTGLGLELDRDLAAGVHLGWQIPEGPGNNFVTWDLGLSWRPTSWLGVGGVAQNIGSPAPGLDVEERYGPGVVLRPLEDRLQFGADYLFTGATGSAPQGLLQLTARGQPVEGVTLRLYADQNAAFGGGVEVYFGRGGVGAHGVTATDETPGVITAYAQSALPERRATTIGQRVAAIRLDEEYPYQSGGGFFSRGGETWLHLQERLRKAAHDPTVAGIVLQLDASPFSFAQIEEIKGLLDEARAQGKRVVVYLDLATDNKAYALASAADQILLHPAADLDIIGLSAELQFLRGTMDLVGIQAQYAKRAEFKSAPEAYTNTEASPAAREEMDALLDDLSQSWAKGIADGRGLTTDKVWEMVDGGPYTAQEALDLDLVDGLKYPDEIEDDVEQIFGKDYAWDDQYAERTGTSGWPGRNEIAVVYVDGAIVSGESKAPGLFGGSRTAGSETIVKQLQQAGRDSSVKAVVMRVDSPGGSSFASDEIWRAVDRLKDKGKPVVVSMGGVAASGGYYVSTDATAIYASPSTITGSIGVYGGKINVDRLLDKVGINTEVYARGRKSAMWSSARPLDEVEFAALDRLVGNTYDQFKDRVAAGRQMDGDKVEEAARGRVWSGKAAKDIGLVDELGGFYDAVARARTEAGLATDARVQLITYGDHPSPDGTMSRREVGLTRTLVLPRAPAPHLELPTGLAALQTWAMMGDDRIWAMMPYTVEVR